MCVCVFVFVFLGGLLLRLQAIGLCCVAIHKTQSVYGKCSCQPAGWTRDAGTLQKTQEAESAGAVPCLQPEVDLFDILWQHRITKLGVLEMAESACAEAMTLKARLR